MCLYVPRELTLYWASCSGLAALSLRQKLDLCEKLGLSPVAAISLLQDLDTVTQDRLDFLDIFVHLTACNEVPIASTHLL